MSLSLLEYTPPAVLLVFLGYAAYQDWKTREVADGVWIAMGLTGLGLLLVEGWGSPPLALGLDTVGALFALEHVIPWDRALGERDSIIGALEVGLYGVVVLLAVYFYLTRPSQTPPDFLAIVLTVLIARTLFETKLLYGGADAKAMMISAVVVPFWATPLLTSYPALITVTPLPYVPFAFSMLVDGAILTLVVPLGILLYNLRKGVHTFPEVFTLYEIPVEELPHRFVWLRRPALEADEDVDTAEEDRDLRRDQAEVLQSRGVKAVWVTPQLPMILALAAGAVMALLVGNFLLWIL